jgi:DNA-binding GntR family transcriptional regulator
VSTLYYHLAGATYRELFEAWVLAESMLAERAARNPDGALRRARMEPYLRPATDDTAVADFVQSHAKFHATVGSLAQNRVLELSLATMGLIVSHHVPLAYDPRTLRERMDSEHVEIATAIMAGRPSRARTLMHDHIQGVAELTTEVMGPLVEDFIEWH